MTSPASQLCLPMSGGMATNYSPGNTKDGCLPPWEVAKAKAYADVIREIANRMSMDPCEVVGERLDDFIAERSTLKGGGSPTPRAVRAVLQKCADKDWHPGKPPTNKGGRLAVLVDVACNDVTTTKINEQRHHQKATMGRCLRLGCEVSSFHSRCRSGRRHWRRAHMPRMMAGCTCTHT